MTNPNALLICPACESPCEAIPPAEYAFVCLGLSIPTWNEDQEGTCACGAEVYVFITGDSDGEYCELRVKEEDEDLPAPEVTPEYWEGWTEALKGET